MKCAQFLLERHTAFWNNLFVVRTISCYRVYAFRHCHNLYMWRMWIFFYLGCQCCISPWNVKYWFNITCVNKIYKGFHKLKISCFFFLCCMRDFIQSNTWMWLDVYYYSMYVMAVFYSFILFWMNKFVWFIFLPKPAW